MNHNMLKLLAVLFGIAFITVMSKNEPAPPVAATRTDACYMSQDFVLDNLMSPSTARFPNMAVANCNAVADGDTWIVDSFVDTQNGFGAMIRADYTVEMHYDPDRNVWTLTHIAITGL